MKTLTPIVALDYPNKEQALNLVESLGSDCDFYKIGSILFTHEGPDFVRELIDRDKKIFLDLKFHDIPNTVAGAVKSAASLGVSLITIHSSGGAEMIRAASEAAAGFKNSPEILCVSVLTSLDEEALYKVGVDKTMKDQVTDLCSLSEEFGADGVVCSVWESLDIKTKFPGLKTLCPGIRLSSDSKGDQARVATPEQAVEARADWIILGRAVTAAENPKNVFLDIKDQIS
jgi:orotidine-5'-phosphate decarboxylase